MPHSGSPFPPFDLRQFPLNERLDLGVSLKKYISPYIYIFAVSSKHQIKVFSKWGKSSVFLQIRSTPGDLVPLKPFFIFWVSSKWGDAQKGNVFLRVQPNRVSDKSGSQFPGAWWTSMRPTSASPSGARLAAAWPGP